MTSPDITSHEIKLALGGLRFDRDLVVGWKLSPSIGLVARDIDRLGLSISTFKEPLARSIKQVMIPSIRKNFEQEGRPAWEPLAEDTVKLRGSRRPVLTRTGTLKRAATSFSIWSIGDASATVRGLPEEAWYGIVHQTGIGGFGQYLTAAKKALGSRATSTEIIREAFHIMEERQPGKVHKVRIPQRRFIMYQEDDIDDIQQVFYEWLVEQTIQAGRFSR